MLSKREAVNGVTGGIRRQEGWPAGLADICDMDTV